MSADRLPTAAEPRPALATFTGLLAVAALLTPLWAPEPDRASGLLLLCGVGAELVNSFRAMTPAAVHKGWAGAGYSLLLALVLLNTSWLAVTALALFLAAPFALDAFRHGAAAVRHAAARTPVRRDAASASLNLAAALGVLLLGRFSPDWITSAK